MLYKFLNYGNLRSPLLLSSYLEGSVHRGLTRLEGFQLHKVANMPVAIKGQGNLVASVHLVNEEHLKVLDFLHGVDKDNTINGTYQRNFYGDKAIIYLPGTVLESLVQPNTKVPSGDWVGDLESFGNVVKCRKG